MSASAPGRVLFLLPLVFLSLRPAEVAAQGAATGEAAGGEWAPARTIPLQKQYVPVMKDGKAVAYKTAYFGHVRVGGSDPRQSFTVVFDTGSGHLILPSTACGSETCTKHRRYNRTQSPSAVDIEYDGTLIRPDATERDQVSIAFGTGEVLGEFVREEICIGSARGATGSSEDVSAEDSSGCVVLRTVLATQMTPDPFGLFAFDGVLGLGLEALALNPQFSFFAQMAEQHPALRPRFAVYLAQNDGGDSEISFGGHNEKRASSELQWAPVAMKELGYWQVQIKSVRVGDKVLEDCATGGCRAILDTGTSLLGVPKHSSRALHRLLARPVPAEKESETSKIDCRAIPGHYLQFELEGGLVVRLGVEDYSRPTPFNMTIPNSDKSRLFCRSLLLPVDMQAPLGPKVFIWGEPVLRRYYTVYDLAAKRVGFTPARQPDLPAAGEGAASTGLPPVGAPPVGSLISGAPLPPMPEQQRQEQQPEQQPPQQQQQQQQPESHQPQSGVASARASATVGASGDTGTFSADDAPTGDRAAEVSSSGVAVA